jgi:hypothetical protein
MGKSAPSPPNPYQTAQAQSQFNTQAAETQAQLDRVNQYTPYGDQTYTHNGNNWSEYTTLSPQEQQLFNTQTGNQLAQGNIEHDLLGNVASTLSTPLNLQTGANGGPIQGHVADPSTFAPQAQQLTQSVLQRLQPFTQQQTNTLDAQLRNQGLVPGTQAYQTAMLQNNQSINDLALGAVATGDQEQQQLYNEALQGGQFANEAQAQMFGQSLQNAGLFNNAQLTMRDQPLNELGALAGGSQVQNPNFSNAPQVQVAAPNYQGAAYDTYNGQFAGNQYNNNLLQGGLQDLFGSWFRI